MQDNLREDLKSLLLKYPELQHSVVDFSKFSSRGLAPQELSKGVPEDTEVSSLASECETIGVERAVIRGHSPKVEVRKSQVHGYGVFAKEVIEEGELIEEMRLLKLGWRANYILEPVLSDYVWANKSCNCSECLSHGHKVYLALGLGSIYNHADITNTILFRNFKNGVMQVKASKRIEKDSEVFITYGSKYFLIRNFVKTVEQNKALEEFLKNKKKSDH